MVHKDVDRTDRRLISHNDTNVSEYREALPVLHDGYIQGQHTNTLIITSIIIESAYHEISRYLARINVVKRYEIILNFEIEDLKN